MDYINGYLADGNSGESCDLCHYENEVAGKLLRSGLIHGGDDDSRPFHADSVIQYI
ncbi:hypothetical protein D1872_347250 [compost metagenome]